MKFCENMKNHVSYANIMFNDCEMYVKAFLVVKWFEVRMNVALSS